MRKKHLGGNAGTHAAAADTFLGTAARELKTAHTCVDLASVKAKLGGAYENLIWAPTDERSDLQLLYNAINRQTNERLRASCMTPIASGLGNRRRR